VLGATDDYRSDEDVLGAWLAERTMTSSQAWAWAADLAQSHADWADKTGERHLSATAIGRKLADRGFERQMRGQGRRIAWLGIGLVSLSAQKDAA